MGWKVIYADSETRIEEGGEMTRSEARAAACKYLEERIARLRPDDPATRRAALRLTLLRLSED